MAVRKYSRKILSEIASLYCTVAMNNGDLPFEKSVQQLLLLTTLLKKWGSGTLSGIVNLTSKVWSGGKPAGGTLSLSKALARITNPRDRAAILTDVLEIGTFVGGLAHRNRHVIKKVAAAWKMSLNLEVFRVRLVKSSSRRKTRPLSITNPRGTHEQA